MSPKALLSRLPVDPYIAAIVGMVCLASLGYQHTAAAPSSPDTLRMPPSPCCFSYMARCSHPRPLWPAHRTGGCTLWCLPRRSFGVVTTIRMEWREVLEVRFRSSGGRSLPRPERLLSEDAERAAGYEVALKVEVIVDGSVDRQEALS